MSDELIEYKIQQLEQDMAEVKTALEDLKKRGIDPKIYVALFGLFGVIFSTLGSIVGTLIMAYLK